MRIQRYTIILVAVLSVLAGFSRAATDNKTFERFYNLSPKQFEEQLNNYILHNHIDSAMLCANIQASKYGKDKLKAEEIKACCIAFRYMGYQYLFSYYNYHLSAENLLNAEQIAEKYEFNQLRTQITVDEAILTAIQNDLENNFVYNQNVVDGFKSAFRCKLDQTKSDNTENNRITTG